MFSRRKFFLNQIAQPATQLHCSQIVRKQHRRGRFIIPGHRDIAQTDHQLAAGYQYESRNPLPFEYQYRSCRHPDERGHERPGNQNTENDPGKEKQPYKNAGEILRQRLMVFRLRRRICWTRRQASFRIAAQGFIATFNTPSRWCAKSS